MLPRSLRLILLAAAVLAAGCPGGCADDGTAPAPVPTGTFTGGLSCRSSDPAARATTLECVTWTYDPARRTLNVVHGNACLNCCPGTAPRVESAAAGLVLVEDEVGGLCDCLCPYDLAYTVTGVPPAATSLAVRGECLLPGEAVLQGELDLAAATSGEFCVERTHDPW